MRIAVTGASGFIGATLVAALAERGDEVTTFVRPSSPVPSSNVVRWDPSRGLVDEGDLRRLGGFDAVVHLAGAGIADKRWSAQRKQEILQSRTDSTALLVTALTSMDSGPEFLASGSAIGYYGPRGNEILDETSARGDGFLSDVCVQWEHAAESWTSAGGKLALLRTGIVMSRHGGALKKQLPLFRAGLGGPLSNGAQWLSPISLRDEVRAILWILDRRLTGPVNLVAPEPVQNEMFTKILANEIHRPAFVRVPAFALKIVLGSELATQAVLASQRVAPRSLADSGFVFENTSSEAIISEALVQ
ncbi:MAG: TIGR01777 family oxidoreductase [Acidimicrobiales bacterium]